MWLLIIGILMMAVTVMIHAVGATYWLGILGKQFSHHKHFHHSLHLFRGIMSTAIALLMLHAVEILLWALVYVELPGRAGLKNYAEAIYFSMITLTTLGYGDVTLSENWQLLAGMEAMVGIMVFGLTTAILFAVVQKSWHIQQSKSKVKTQAIDRKRSETSLANHDP